MGFTFKGVHSSEMGIGVKSAARYLKPGGRVRKTVIAGRSGTYDSTDGTYENTVITVLCDYVGKNMREAARRTALFLSGRGDLVFDDEPDKYYTASVFSPIQLEELLIVQQFEVEFECFPLASSGLREAYGEVTSYADGISLHSEGTAPSPCRITVKNNGETQISNLRITHTAN